MKSRDLLILTAGLPGVATPFLPFATGLFVNDVTPLWLARRLWPGDPRPSERRSVLFLSALALAITIATCGLFGVASMLEGEAGGLVLVAVLLSLIAGNAAALMWNRRRQAPLHDAAECFLLGCYLCHAVFLLIVFIPELDVGGWLVAWTCVVYTATIVLRNWNSTSATAI